MKSTSLSLYTIVGLGLVAMSPPMSASARPLFEPVSYLTRDGATAASQPALATTLASPATVGAQLVQVDAAAVEGNSRALEFELGGHKVNATLARSEQLEGGNSVWYGNIAPRSGRLARTPSGVDPLNSAILVRSGDTITGTLRHEGALYRLRPLPDGRHVLVEVDENRLPQEHPGDYATLPQVAMPVAAQQDGRVGTAAVSSGPQVTIRVLVVATNGAVNAYGGNMQALAQLAVAESNQGYINSNVGITLQLAAYQAVNYTETGNWSTDLARFRGTSDGYMDAIHGTRNSSAADVAVILFNNASACGLASGIGSSAATAFASAHWDCATGYYSFAHEIGHLQSARHDIATDPSATPYAYGHGYRYSNSWRTIMAYACTGGCPRLNYWSNPNISYGGVPMGNASSADNQRVLVNTKQAVAAFR